MPAQATFTQSHRPHDAGELCLRSSGFTYIGLLIMIAIISLAATATLQVGAVQERRAAEEELLEIGAEYSQALASYATASPPGQKRSPGTLQDLLRDRRFPTPRRHLRKIYADPITGKTEWGLVMAPDGSGIIGIYSLSNAQPIKIANFDTPNENFAKKTSYRFWVFKSP
ncbi:MAG: type II secretion system protein [Burkholderiaceae bacterium]